MANANHTGLRAVADHIWRAGASNIWLRAVNALLAAVEAIGVVIGDRLAPPANKRHSIAALNARRLAAARHAVYAAVAALHW